MGQPGRGPFQPTSHAVDQADRRPADLVVVVLVGIQFGEGRAVPVELQVFHGGAGSVACIVPALESQDRHRPVVLTVIVGHVRSLRGAGWGFRRTTRRPTQEPDRKSTRLNSSHVSISY